MEDPNARPNVLLITVDSLRADAVATDEPATPAVDRLAEEGIVYERAFAQGTFTTLSMPSLFTSRYPSSLPPVGVVEDMVGSAVTGVPTLTEALHDAGYATAGFHSNPLLSDPFGFDEGFDTFDSQLPLAGVPRLPGRAKILTDKLLRLVRKHAYLPGERLTDRALNWLDRRPGDRPFFCWLHYMDVHGPYQSKSGNAYANKLRAERLWRKAVASPGDLTDTERERLRRTYREEVEYTDGCVGRLLDGLRRRGLLEETVCVLTADHGEEFGEHGRYSHPDHLYDEVVHVPLVVRRPDREPGRADHPVELVDVAPTVLEAVGAEPPAPFAGRRLSDPAPGHAISEAGVAPTYKAGVRTDRWKYIRYGDREELYDLRADPGEQTDVAGNHPSVLADLSGTLDDHLATHGTHTGAEDVSDVGIEDGEARDRLEDLGYLG
ncbi:MAG: sulfatase [Haloarculaceae archaeon]